jgi:hypothetical protein
MALPASTPDVTVSKAIRRPAGVETAIDADCTVIGTI